MNHMMARGSRTALPQLLPAYRQRLTFFCDVFYPLRQTPRNSIVLSSPSTLLNS